MVPAFLYEGYGLTETSPVVSVNTFNQPNMLRVGTVGSSSGTPSHIAEDGEILVKGHQTMIGYYKDEEDGRSAQGRLVPHRRHRRLRRRFLRITDRKKEMGKTSGGKYVARSSSRMPSRPPLRGAGHGR